MDKDLNGVSSTWSSPPLTFSHVCDRGAAMVHAVSQSSPWPYSLSDRTLVYPAAIISRPSGRARHDVSPALGSERARVFSIQVKAYTCVQITSITHNIPSVLRDPAVALVGDHCYTVLVYDFDITHAECLKYALSKGLGVGIVLGGAVVKIPQVCVALCIL